MLLVVALGAGCGDQPPAPAAAPVPLTIYHFNDFHAAWTPLTRPTDQGGDGGQEWAGAVNIAGMIKQFRRDDSSCIVAFGGDMFLANPVDSRTQGASTVELFRAFAPDVATLGNHEFDYGREQLLQLRKRINWPLVCANVTWQNQPLVDETVVLERNGLKILCVGLFPTNGAKYYEEDHDVAISEALPAVKKALAAAAGDHDLTVIVSHLGDDADVALAKALPADLGVDVIIGAHTHTALKEAITEHGIIITQAGANGEYFGKLELLVDPAANTAQLTAYALLPVQDGSEDADPAVAQLLQAELAAVAGLREPLATLDQPLWNSGRSEETPLGNFVTDAYVDIFHADLAFVDSKGLRRYIAGPELTEFDLRGALSGERPLQKVRMSGADLRKFLDYYVKKDDRYMSIPYTLSYTYSGSGSRAKLDELLFRDEPIDEEREYTVIAEDRLAETMCKFNGGELLGDAAGDGVAVLIDWAKRQRTLTLRAGNRRQQAGAAGQRDRDRPRRRDAA